MAPNFEPLLFSNEPRLAAAASGDASACFELGMAFSCGSDGLRYDPVAAHMWFNLAAMSGEMRALGQRAEIAREMDSRQIAEAQRQARSLLAARSPAQAA